MTRIVCPACSAAYEVPDAAIPPGGRDVQCAACGHNWFQLWLGEVPQGTVAWVNPSAGPAPDAGDSSGSPETPARAGRSARAKAQPQAGFAETPQSPLAETTTRFPSHKTTGQEYAEDPVGVTAPQSAGSRRDLDDKPTARPVASQAVPKDVPGAAQEGPPLFDEEQQFELPVPRRRRIDPQVLAVLRSEAEVETEARRIDAQNPLESQGELPLVPQPRRSASDVRARLARLQEAERQSNGDVRWTHSADLPSDPPETPPDLGAVRKGFGFPPLPPVAKPRPAPPKPPQQDRTQIEPSAPSHTPQSRTLPAKVSSRALAAYQEQQARRGFQIGFTVPVALVAVALGLYLVAPRLLDRLPAAEPALSALILHGDQVQERLAEKILVVFERLTPSGGT